MRLAFAGVKAGPARDPGPVALRDDRLRAADGARGPVEGCAEAVPARGQHVAAVPLDVGAGHLGEALSRRRALGSGDGARRVDEHHGGDHSVGLGLRPRSRHQLLDLGHDRLYVTDPRQVIRAGQLDVTRPRNVLGHVPGVRDVHRHLAGSVEDHDRNTDRRQQRSHIHVEHHPQQRAGCGRCRRQALCPPPCTPRRVVSGQRRSHRREVAAVTPLALEPIERFVHRLAAPVAPDEAASPVVAREAAPEQQPERTLGIRGREQQAHRATFGRAQERRPVRSDRLHHGSHVVHPLLERRQAVLGHPIRQARATLVEHDQPTERRQPPIERRERRRFPRHLEMRDVAADDDQVGRTIAQNLVGDVSISTLDVTRLWLAAHTRPRA